MEQRKRPKIQKEPTGQFGATLDFPCNWERAVHKVIVRRSGHPEYCDLQTSPTPNSQSPRSPIPSTNPTANLAHFWDLTWTQTTEQGTKLFFFGCLIGFPFSVWIFFTFLYLDILPLFLFLFYSSFFPHLSLMCKHCIVSLL